MTNNLTLIELQELAMNQARFQCELCGSRGMLRVYRIDLTRCVASDMSAQEYLNNHQVLCKTCYTMLTTHGITNGFIDADGNDTVPVPILSGLR